MTIKSELFSLKKIVTELGSKWYFNVPIYQRLYVWDDDQVNVLLTDIANAYDRNEEQFFLGGAMVVEQKNEKERQQDRYYFDLIDGQQRFTTLWLLGTVAPWSDVLRDFSVVQEDNKELPRLQFSIRDHINEYLQELLDDPNTISDEIEDTENLRKAQMLMRSFAKTRRAPDGRPVDDGYIKGLSDFIYKKVQLVLTRVSQDLDLNKLFEVINNRGVQLQHHEILKSQLLHAVPAKERGRYGAIWDACADMEGFIERSLCSVTRLEAHQLGNLYANGKLACFEAVNDLLLKSETEEGIDERQDLASIVNLAQSEGEDLKAYKDAADGDIADDEIWAKSIIGFPLFLQHVLRIWLYEQGYKDVNFLLDKQLLAIFQNNFFVYEEDKAEKARGFIELLWRVRVLWDEYVIKWVDQSDEVVHQICATAVSDSKGKRYVNRSREGTSHQGLSLLQSMLYHSQEITTHYWLTPFLYYLHQGSTPARAREGDSQRCYNYLCHLDNQLLGEITSESLVKRTHQFMEDVWRKALSIGFEQELAPEVRKGVGFSHYWFYKLDFVLWYERRQSQSLWQNFRFTAKNSVEHISPQTPKKIDRDKVSPDMIDTFGNLALVSRSINSEYSNLPFNEKKKRFENKRAHDKKPESLKMDLIYESESWGDAEVKKHHDCMLALLRHYYRRDFENLFK